jgi:hydroxypyruvate isomerase
VVSALAPIGRRAALAALAGAALGGAGLAAPAAASARPLPDDSASSGAARKGRIRQSVSRWPYREIPLPEFSRAVRAMGIVAIDLLPGAEWPLVRDAGLVCSMGYPATGSTVRDDFIATGFNDRRNHPMLLRELEGAIPLAARHGVPNVIGMFGNRGGRSDAAAVDACVEGLRRIAPLAEEHGVTVCIELLNSKVDHADYQGDRTAFGARVVDGVGSPRVKLLYDIYHMQIMEGDVIRTIRDNKARIAHFHTGGVPGRHELDDTQELNWRAVMRAIADSGFTGFVAHEFVPTRDPLTSLREAVEVCDV